MKFCLFTMHGDLIKPMWQLTLPNKEEYCLRHSYELMVVPVSWEIGPGWERIIYMREFLKSNRIDWIFWLGADCLITNLTLPLDSLTDGAQGMVIAYDAYQNNFDSVLVRCCPRMVELFERILDSYPVRVSHPLGEQQALEELIPAFKADIKIVPQRKMNAYDYTTLRQYAEIYSERYLTGVDVFGNDGQWRPGDFIFHSPGVPLEQKMKNLQAVLPQIVR